MILTLISLLITIVYLTYTIKLFGVPWSISETYYLLEKRKKGSGILFTLWTWTAGLPLLVAWLNITSGTDYQFLPFLACGSLMMLGTATQFKQSLTEMVHYVSAGICVVSALIWLILIGYGYIPFILLSISILLGLKYKKWITWIEIAALCSAYLTLILIWYGTSI